MDDQTLLRRTIRRATAVLVATVSLLTFVASDAAKFPAAVLFTGAAVYLVASFVFTSPSEIAGSSGGPPATGDETGEA
ncbi:MAG: hypothetical protein ABEJ85_02715 [Haloarculaceae archaeon]